MWDYQNRMNQCEQTEMARKVYIPFYVSQLKCEKDETELMRLTYSIPREVPFQSSSFN